jgi:hypothetical protein
MTILKPARRARIEGCGIPRNLFLIEALDGGNKKRVVPMMSSASWQSYGQLDKWTNRARDSRMPFELDHKEGLSKVIAVDVELGDSSRLRKAFYNGESAEESNTSLWHEWGQLATDKNAKKPTFYDHSTLVAAPFNYQKLKKITRCRRCRTLFRFQVPDEPYEFREGPWKDLSSCAEMLSETECKRWGLH